MEINVFWKSVLLMVFCFFFFNKILISVKISCTIWWDIVLTIDYHNDDGSNDDEDDSEDDNDNDDNNE